MDPWPFSSPKEIRLPRHFSHRSPSALSQPFCGWEGSLTKIDYRKVGAHILTSLLEDLVAFHAWTVGQQLSLLLGCTHPGIPWTPVFQVRQRRAQLEQPGRSKTAGPSQRGRAMLLGERGLDSTWKADTYVPWKSGTFIWQWLKIGTQNGLPRQLEAWTKICGPIPGVLVLTHTHVVLCLQGKHLSYQKGCPKTWQSAHGSKTSSYTWLCQGWSSTW